MKIPPVPLFCAKVPTKAPQSGKKWHFGRPRGANGRQMVPKRRQNGGKIVSQSDFLPKVPKVIRTCYLLYIINICRPVNPHFSIPRPTKNACGTRATTFSLHGRHFWPHCGQKMARVGSPGNPNAPQGLPNASPNAPKNDYWQDRVALTALGVPTPPQKYLKICQNLQKHKRTQ